MYKKVYDSSSKESNYSTQHSDMSDYTISDEHTLYDGMPSKENDNDLDPEISHDLMIIEYYIGSAQIYVVNDWVLVQFCTRKIIKHFVGQITLYVYNGETPQSSMSGKSAQLKSINICIS